MNKQTCSLCSTTGRQCKHRTIAAHNNVYGLNGSRSESRFLLILVFERGINFFSHFSKKNNATWNQWDLLKISLAQAAKALLPRCHQPSSVWATTGPNESHHRHHRDTPGGSKSSDQVTNQQSQGGQTARQVLGQSQVRASCCTGRKVLGIVFRLS